MANETPIFRPSHFVYPSYDLRQSWFYYHKYKWHCSHSFIMSLFISKPVMSSVEAFHLMELYCLKLVITTDTFFNWFTRKRIACTWRRRNQKEDWIRRVPGLINTWCVYVPPIDTFQPFVLVWQLWLQCHSLNHSAPDQNSN